MDKKHWQDSLQTLGQAIQKLQEALDKTTARLEDIEIYRDATIQRFKFTVELFWKVLKKFLNYERLEANTPREVLKKGYAAQIIDKEEMWLGMMSDRNLTVRVRNSA
ncbi:hypothetical protein MIDIC_340026 [Alphaproteobacteria bacterium]